MLEIFVRFLIFLIRDDSGAAVPAAVLPLVARAGLGLLAIHGLHHHLAQTPGVMPDSLGSLDPGAAVPVVAGAWEWAGDNKINKIMFCDKNMARDRNIFAVPQLADPPTDLGRLHSGQTTKVVAWRWPGDDRVFLIPAELFRVARLGGLVRDVVSAVGQLYREQKFPEFPAQISTSYRRISEMLCVASNGRTTKAIEECLAYARSFTIIDHPVIIQLDKATGKVKKQDRVVFGYIDYVTRADIINGKKIAKNWAPLNIILSTLYATALRELPTAPLPVVALEAAHHAPWKLATPAKNLAYYLAARVPMREFRLLLPTLRDILGLTEHSKITRTRKAIENVLNILHPLMISDYQYANAGYDLTLSGNIKNNKMRRIRH